MEMAEIPDSLTRFLKAHFPTLPIRPSWLAECVEYLRSDEGVQSDSKLNSETLNQILMANLEDVASHSVLPEGIEDLASGTIGSPTNLHKTSVLVQIVSLSDIGVSAQNQIDVLEARKAVKNSPGMAALLNTQNANPDNVNDAGATQNGTQANGNDDHMRAFGEQEQEIQKSSTVFSRSMLQLFVTDGHSPPIPAFEKVRIPELDQATTLLGCKLLLKGAQVRRGQILLEPKCVVIKGGSIPEWTEVADLTMMNLLRKRNNKPPLEAEQARPQLNDNQPEEQFNVDSDEEAALQMQEEDERNRNRNRQNGRGHQSSATIGNSSNENQRRNQTPDFDDEEADELFAMVDENEAQVVGGSRNGTQQNGSRSNSGGNNNRHPSDWVGNNEVIDLSDSP